MHATTAYFYWRPHVTTIHDLTLLNTYNSDKNWFVFHAKQLVGKAVFTVIAQTNRVIFTPTAYTQQNYEAYAPAARGKTVLTYESADKLHHNATVPYPHRFKKFLLYVGQQSDYKNIARLGDAHQQLLKLTQISAYYSLEN